MKKKIKAEEYRKPMLITHYDECKHIDSQGRCTIEVWPKCPRCNGVTRADYQKHCTECGQRLRWNYSKMKPSK